MSGEGAGGNEALKARAEKVAGHGLFHCAREAGSFVRGTGRRRQLHVKMLELPARRNQMFRPARLFSDRPGHRALSPKISLCRSFSPSHSNPSPKESQSKLTHRDILQGVLSPQPHTKLWEKVPGQPRTGDFASTRRHRSCAVSALLPGLLRALYRLHLAAPHLLLSRPKLFTTDEDMSPSGARFGLAHGGLRGWGGAWIPRGSLGRWLASSSAEVLSSRR